MNDEYPPEYWVDFDDDDFDDDDYPQCCVCSCLIGDEVGLGDTNYFGDGRPICESCMDAVLP